jgi:PST family polysaccharide transporter
LKPFDASGAFAPSVPGGGRALRALAVRGAGMNIFSSAVSILIQLVATVVLGHLLLPRDFGLVAMVTTFSLLLMNATANGFIDAMLQRKDMTHALASNLFWINIGTALLLTVFFAACGPLLARFYSEPQVAHIAVAMSVMILLSCAPAVHATLLRRAMLFPAIARNDILARAVGVIVSICFGKAGWGYWSLVMGQCALSFSTMIGIFILCPWMPGRPRRLVGTRSTVTFAGHIAMRFGVNYFVSNFDNLLVGWRFGAHALGYYKKAYDLFALSLTQLVFTNSNVAVAALSRVREDRPQYIRYLLGATGMLAFIGMGLAGDFTLVGRDLIRVLLGSRWDTAGWIFTFFAPGIGIMLVYGIHGWIHVSLGHADRWLKWGIVEWVVTCSLFLAALPWGPEGIAVAWGVSFWLLALPALWYAGKPIDLGVTPVIGVIWRYTLAALAAGFSGYAILSRSGWLVRLAGAGGAAIRVTCGTVLFSALYLVFVAILYRGIKPLRTMATLIGELRQRKHPSAATLEGASA